MPKKGGLLPILPILIAIVVVLLIIYIVTRRESPVVKCTNFMSDMMEGFAPAVTTPTCPTGFRFFNTKRGDSMCCSGVVNRYTHTCEVSEKEDKSRVVAINRIGSGSGFYAPAYMHEPTKTLYFMDPNLPTCGLPVSNETWKSNAEGHPSIGRNELAELQARGYKLAPLLNCASISKSNIFVVTPDATLNVIPSKAQYNWRFYPVYMFPNSKEFFFVDPRNACRLAVTFATTERNAEQYKVITERDLQNNIMNSAWVNKGWLESCGDITLANAPTICSMKPGVIDPKTKLPYMLCSDLVKNRHTATQEAHCPSRFRHFASVGKCCLTGSDMDGYECIDADAADPKRYCVIAGDLKKGETYCHNIKIQEGAVCPPGLQKVNYKFGEREQEKYGAVANNVEIPTCFGMDRSCIPDSVIRSLHSRGMFTDKSDLESWKYSCSGYDRVYVQRDLTSTMDESYL